MSSQTVVLVVDPDARAAEELGAILVEDGLGFVTSSSGRDALEALNREPARVLVTDLEPGDMTCLQLLTAVEERWPGLPVIVSGEGAGAAEVMAALRAGAADFLEKPYVPEQIGFVMQKALARADSSKRLPPPPASTARVGILGHSPSIRQMQESLMLAAQGTATVLIRGESGTGKELAARAIHDASRRSEQPFVKIDCAALPDNLLESELFGYEKGAFTGAVSRKPGRAELADKGTLFLDEIGELGLPLQAKLLRLLQDRAFERLGGTKTIQVDVRVVAATHRDLESMVERNEFRLDLFYRLNVVPIWLPPLRARREDIGLLAQHFCKNFAAANGKPGLAIDDDALKVLRSQRWPGNVRQLQNLVERLVVLSVEPRISEDLVRRELSVQLPFKTEPGATAEPRPKVDQDVPDSGTAETVARRPAGTESVVVPLDAALREAEKMALERALRHAKGNRSLAARLLGVSRSTLYAKLQEHGLMALP